MANNKTQAEASFFMFFPKLHNFQKTAEFRIPQNPLSSLSQDCHSPYSFPWLPASAYIKKETECQTKKAGRPPISGPWAGAPRGSYWNAAPALTLAGPLTMILLILKMQELMLESAQTRTLKVISRLPGWGIRVIV
jgi:hypothetical protein